jgi:hypothetical protein
MPHDLIEFHGSYRYADRATLEHALSQARAELREDDELESDSMWMRAFVTKGTILTVNVSVPAAAQHRFAAANVFLILAHGAVEGAVDSRGSMSSLDDRFDSGPED